MYLAMSQCPARAIPANIREASPAVKDWTDRVLNRDSSIPTGLSFKWGTSESTAMIFDAIMCNTWLADQMLQNAMKPNANVTVAKQAAAHYKYIADNLWPRWTHRPQVAQQDPLTSIRSIVGKYYLARAIEYDILRQVAKDKNYSANMQRQLNVNSAHAYGNCAQLLPGQYETYWTRAMARSAEALEMKGKALTQSANSSSTEAWGQAVACFRESSLRYNSCQMSSESARCQESQEQAEASNCATHNSPTELPPWGFMSPTV